MKLPQDYSAADLSLQSKKWLGVDEVILAVYKVTHPFHALVGSNLVVRKLCFVVCGNVLEDLLDDVVQSQLQVCQEMLHASRLALAKAGAPP